MFVIFFLFVFITTLSQVFIEDSAVVFIERNSTVKVTIKNKLQFYVKNGGKLEKINDEKIPFRRKLNLVKSSAAFVKKNEDNESSKNSRTKKLDTQDNILYYKLKENSTSFSIYSQNDYKIVVPSYTHYIVNELKEQKVFFLRFCDQDHNSFFIQTVPKSENRISYSIRPPPVM